MLGETVVIEVVQPRGPVTALFAIGYQRSLESLRQSCPLQLESMRLRATASIRLLEGCGGSTRQQDDTLDARVREGYVGISFCRGSSFEVVEGLRKGFIVKFVVWGELRQEGKKARKKVLPHLILILVLSRLHYHNSRLPHLFPFSHPS